MGKEESDNTSNENNSNEDKKVEDTSTSKGENTSDTDSKVETEKSNNDKKEDVEKIRTIIKVNGEENNSEESKENNSEEKDNKQKESEENKEKEDNKPPSDAPPQKTQPNQSPDSGSREELEQRRNILQSIKDFDFQIKKNQEDVNKISEKIDGVTKDLDDLVSLYEIVSEQMNPFVGLSKVTKKRIDALENFTQEIEDIKNRMDDVESVVEKSAGGIEKLTKKFDKNNQDDKKNVSLEKTPVNEQESEDTSEQINEDDVSKEDPEKQMGENKSQEKTDIVETNDITNQNLGEVTEPNQTEIKEKTEEIASNDETSNIQKIEVDMSYTNNDKSQQFSDFDLDKILSESLESLVIEQNIENMINDFLLNLK